MQPATHLQNVHKANTVPPNTVGSVALFGTFPIVKVEPTEPVGAPPAGRQLEFTIYQDLDIPLDKLDFNWAMARSGHTASGSDEGITENNHISHVAIGGPYQDFWGRRTLVARNNYYHNVNVGPDQLLLNASFWNGSIILESLDYDDSELVCPTLALHSFAEYENSIAIAKLYQTEPTGNTLPWVPRHGFIKKPAPPTLPDIVSIIASATDANLYQGAFAVLDTPDSRTFTYEANGTLTVKATTPSYRPGTFLGDQGKRPIESIAPPTQVGSLWKITATVRPLYGYPVNHGMQAGDIVLVTNAGVHPNHSTILNGFFKVTAVEAGSNPGWFEYNVTQQPDVSGDFSPGYYGRMWGLDWCLLENNIIELNIRTMGPIGFNEPVGIFLYGGGSQPQYRMRQVVIRGNLIRNIDNRSDPKRGTGYTSFAESIRMEDAFLAENTLWQNNIIRLDRDDIGGLNASMTHLGTQLRTFDNNSPAAKLLRSRDRATATITAPEQVTIIQAAIEEALLAAFVQ